MPNLSDFEFESIDGALQERGRFEGQVLLVVNVASQCGLTPQYSGLQALQERYAERGFTVLGFPCNQFGGQEPGSPDEIKTFCETNFQVTFPLAAKIDVNGDARAPLYGWLTAESTAPDGPGDIQWNFEKFLIGRDGSVVARFAPMTAPDDEALVQAIEGALG